LDIFDWWTAARREDGQFKLSSRRLCAVIKALPDDSAFRKATRDGDWSDYEYLVAATVNELRTMRADNAAMNGQKLDVAYVHSPRQAEEDALDKKQKAQIRESILKQLHRGRQQELTTE
jgi:hypothetical protein